MEMSEDLGTSADYEEDEDEQHDVTLDMAKEVESLPNYEMYESDGGESLSDGQLSLSDDENEPPADSTADAPKTSWNEQVRLIHLRRYIDELAEKVKEKDYEVAKGRAEDKECSNRLEELEREWKLVNHDRENAEREANVPTADRLMSQLQRIQLEIESEQKLQKQIKQNLTEAEYELAQCQVEQGKMLLAEDDLIKREEKVKKEKEAQAKQRDRKSVV